jgi:hypothetical protein
MTEHQTVFVRVSRSEPDFWTTAPVGTHNVSTEHCTCGACSSETTIATWDVVESEMVELLQWCKTEGFSTPDIVEGRDIASTWTDPNVVEWFADE